MKEDFEMPMIVRQKGLIDDTLKVYIESNVIQFIKEMKEKTKLGNRYAALVGKRKQLEGEECLVIEGAVKCNCRNHINLEDYFIKQVRGYIESKVKMYFGDDKIVGLVSINKFDYEEKNECIKTAFEKLFRDDYDLLFMQNKFSEELYYFLNDEISELNGYFIYYEENEKMKEYMSLEEIEIIDDEEEEEDKEIVNNKINKRRGDMVKMEREERKEGALIPGLLFVLSVILGIGLLKTIDDISNVENSLMNIDRKYTEMSEKIEMQNETIEVISMSAVSDRVRNSSIEADEDDDSDADEDTEDEEPENIEEMYTLYEVKEGDTLKSISSMVYGTEGQATKIKEYNKLENENLIKAGDILKLPASNN